MAIFPLPRKLLTDPAAADLRREVEANMKVHGDCVDMWKKRGKHGHTFIGLIDTDTWVVYLAPCFGVKPKEAILKLSRDITKSDALAARAAALSEDACVGLLTESGVSASGGRLGVALYDILAKCQVPDNLRVVSGSTSREDDAAREFTWADVKGVYGIGGSCLVLFEKLPPSFDGLSHKSMSRWVSHKVLPAPAKDWFNRSMGFAIQRDDLSYYVRYASTLNEKQGQLSGEVFDPRPDPSKKKGHEIRDLPKQWAFQLVTVLARDLQTGHFPPHGDRFFDRMVSRNEKETTKYTRIHEGFKDNVARSLKEVEGKKEWSLSSAVESFNNRLT